MAQVAHIGASGCQGDEAALACARGQQLALARVRNVRDLGGYTYRAEDGSRGETAFGVFLRGPSLRRLGSRDFEVLRSYGQGLICVIDLRSDFETRHWPDPYASARDGVTYVHIPMLDRLHAKGIRDAIPDRMFTVYKSLLDNDALSIREVMKAVDRYGSGGCTLFHCRVGKDRTGVMAMLLLGLAGVSDADILEDFAATQRYIGRGTGVQRVALSIVTLRRAPRSLFEAVPAEMELTLEHLHEQYGSARAYLEDYAQVPASVLDRIARRLRGGW